MGSGVLFAMFDALDIWMRLTTLAVMQQYSWYYLQLRKTILDNVTLMFQLTCYPQLLRVGVVFAAV